MQYINNFPPEVLLWYSNTKKIHRKLQQQNENKWKLVYVR